MPYVVSPLTDDVQITRSMLPSLSTDIVPVQGSRISLALVSPELVDAKYARSVWLLTDSTPDSEAARIAQNLPITASVIMGVGTTSAPIQEKNGGFVKDSTTIL